MPIMNGMEAIRAILEKAPEAKLIVLTAPSMGTKTSTGHCRLVRRLIC
jgi:DNA-binding NarL/FixJ family response regulator